MNHFRTSVNPPMMWSHFAMVTMVYSNGANNKINHFRRSVNSPILFSQSGHWQGPHLTWKVGLVWNWQLSIKLNLIELQWCALMSYMMWSHFSMVTMEHYITAHSSVSIWHAQCPNYKWSPCLHRSTASCIFVQCWHWGAGSLPSARHHQ